MFFRDGNLGGPSGEAHTEGQLETQIRLYRLHYTYERTLNWAEEAVGRGGEQGRSSKDQ